jgi:hypothetical protein
MRAGVLTRAGVLIAAVAAAFMSLLAGSAVACDPLDPSACLYPWPNDHFTRADPTSAPRNSPLARRQKSEFLRADGALIDVCDGAPCVP